jgi:hypothetical protein
MERSLAASAGSTVAAEGFEESAGRAVLALVKRLKIPPLDAGRVVGGSDEGDLVLTVKLLFFPVASTLVPETTVVFVEEAGTFELRLVRPKGDLGLRLLNILDGLKARSLRLLFFSSTVESSGLLA